jgi:hypothetical protein
MLFAAGLEDRAQEGGYVVERDRALIEHGGEGLRHVWRTGKHFGRAVSAGSTAALPIRLAPLRVRSAQGERTTAPAGEGRPASRSRSIRASVRPPPADSPTTANDRGSVPVWSSAR